MNDFRHVPVLAQEVIEILQPKAKGKYLDGTLGGGGHTEQILIHSSPDGQIIGIDRDDEAVELARRRLKQFQDRVKVRKANFADARAVLNELGWNAVDGVLLDLGFSSHQLEAGDRGFSFQKDSNLDMRMDRGQSLDAYQVVNVFPVRELVRILREYGEEQDARRIAKAIEAARKRKPIETTTQLAQIVESAKGKRRRDHHPATKTFQAIRIAVNQELRNLETFLDDGYELLSPKGRMVIISFHSLEDRLVKAAFRKWSRDCLCPPKTPVCRCGWNQKARLVTPRPRVPSIAEIRSNPRARSAKLRAVERL